MNTTKKNHSFLTVGAIILAVVMPLIISFVYLKMYESGSNLGSRNTGSLLNTTVSLQDFQIENIASGKAQGKWILLQVFDENCTGTCQDRALMIGNLVESLGKHNKRVQATIIYDSLSKEKFLEQYNPVYSPKQKIEVQHQGQEIVYHHPINAFVLENNQIKKILKDLNAILKNSDETNQANLFLVDPLHRFVLAYDNSISRKQIEKDILILLKSSLIG